MLRFRAPWSSTGRALWLGPAPLLKAPSMAKLSPSARTGEERQSPSPSALLLLLASRAAVAAAVVSRMAWIAAASLTTASVTAALARTRAVAS